MVEMISASTQVTSEWLTHLLRESGALTDGHVTNFEMEANDAWNSEVVHLRVSYSDDASGPSRLLLKLKSKHWGKDEVNFYRLVQNETVPMLVRCYAADYDEVSGASLCLLDDLSHTHGQPITLKQCLNGEGVPNDAHLNQIIDVLAKFHAHWWEHPWLSEKFNLPEWLLSAESYAGFTDKIKGQYESFIRDEGHDFPQEFADLYEHALDHLPSLWAQQFAPRIESGRSMTLCHGDCYFGQFLCPHEVSQSTTYLIDFDAVHPNMPGHDLVYLLPTFWTRTQRQTNQREETLLRQYHATLQAQGVKDYDWDNLIHDYRLNLTLMIFDPIWNQTDGSSKAYWWPKLECLVHAYQDWDCKGLFE